MPRRSIGSHSWIITVVIGLLLCACAGNEPAGSVQGSALGDDAITLASFNFPESVTLTEVYAQALERAGYAVRLQLNLGARELVDPALERGLVEFVPEYAGTALSFVTSGVQPSADEQRTHQDLRAAFADRNIDVLAPAPAQDRNGVAVTAATADRYGLESIADLAPVAPQLVFGGPPECPDRPLCLPGLEQTYGLRFREFVPLDAGGQLTHEALSAGSVDAALVFTSDGAIGPDHLVLLDDDRHLQPAENVTPIVRREVVTRYGQDFVRVVDSVSETLTTAALRSMNQRVSGGATPHDAAAEFLRSWTAP
jgi:osmoprotectant transport system substrate-binding protein